MEERKWKITTTKDTMLHVLNNIFNQNVKASLKKEEILNLIPNIYNDEILIKVVEVISYEAYQSLEKIFEYMQNGVSLNEAMEKVDYVGRANLEDAMIIVNRQSGRDIEYSLTVNDVKDLAPMFSNENKKLAKRYDKIEKLITGLIYSYGAVEIETLRKMICKYMNEIIPEDEIYGFIFKRLDLNMLVDYHYIHWENNGQDECYISYIDDEDIDVSQIAAEQKGRGLKYKFIKESEVLTRGEFFWNEKTQEFYEYLKTRNDRLTERHFKLLTKKSELGEDILEDLLMISAIFSEDEANEFMGKFMEWYNNSPQYMLGGYTPNEMMRMER